MGYVYRGNQPLKAREVKAATQGRRPYGTAVCGTNAMYQAHIRKGEPIDDACNQAHLQDQADRRAKARAYRAAQKQKNQQS